MGKLSIKRFASPDDARTHYLNQIDQLGAMVPATVSAVREAKWQEVQDGGGPILEAEADALDMTLHAVIDSVTDARRRWCEAEAAREAARIKSKHRIRQADNPADMHRALTNYQAALEAAFSCPEDA